MNGGDRGSRLAIEPQCAHDAQLLDTVSFAEEQLWAEQTGAPAVPFLNCRSTMSMVARLQGSIDPGALSASLDAIVDRHEVLRSVFGTIDGRLERRYEPSASVTVNVIDLGDVRGADQSVRLEHVVAEVSRAPFDVGRPPLLRAALVKLGQDDHVMAIAVPHLVFDRWSKRVLAQELTALYAAHINGVSPDLERLSVQYRDYIRWQRERLEGDHGHTLREYWRTRLAIPSNAQLPGDGGSTRTPSTRSGIRSLSIPAHDTARLTELSRRSRVTMATLMFAIVRVFIHRVSGEGDVAIGVPVTDRRRREFEPLIGLFMNLLVVRTTTSDNMTFANVLDSARRALVDASRHQDMPYGYLLRILPVANPQFRILFSFMPELPESVAEFPGVRVTPMRTERDEPAMVDLAVQILAVSGRLVCRLVYKPELFSRARIRGFAEQLQSVVRHVLDCPDKSIGAASV